MNIHFIAIGGSAMHNLALALHQAGDRITGSDDEIFEPSRSRLARAGILPKEMGWFPERITADLDCVILGMHAREDNPELIRAKETGLKIYSYPEYIYERTRNKTRVVIAGSHGKTTITGMILHVLHYHDREEDFMVGAQLEGYDTMVSLSTPGNFAVLEGDEYLSSPIDRRPKFHLYHPNIALLSGVAWDHINVFPTFEDYLEPFRIFLNSILPGGALVYCADDPEVVKLVDGIQNEIKLFPYKTPDYRIENGICYLDTPEGEVPLRIFGKHNLLNLEGARWICQKMGIQAQEFYEAMTSFTGASKRLEKLAEAGGSVVFKDFAHAPSKVKATVQAVAENYPGKKIVACLELHTFSSLNPEFLPAYRSSMDPADVSMVYFNPDAVAHKKLPPLSIEAVAGAFGRSDLIVETRSDRVLEQLQKAGQAGTVYLMMSSGNFDGADLNSWAEILVGAGE